MRARSAAVVFLWAIVPSSVLAQGPTVPDPNAIYLEVLGNGGVFSLNYQRMVSPILGLRLGAGGWESSGFWSDATTSFLTFPLTLSFLPGGGRSGWEFGGGLLLGRAKEESPDYGLGEDPGSTSTGIVDLTGILGYRWVRESGWLFRLAFTPFLALSGDYPDRTFFPSGGLSVGKAF